jgi:hypothetical protein
VSGSGENGFRRQNINRNAAAQTGQKHKKRQPKSNGSGKQAFFRSL